MHEVSLAFLWHQHQPYYPDDVAGETAMPWVRLHGTKDYWGMAMLLAEVPEMHATINLVPSLLSQLLAYTRSGREDKHQRVSRLPADGLSEDDMHYLLDNFFMVHVDRMIRPFSRYSELFNKRGIDVDSAEVAGKRFSKRDIIDLQVWSNLVWIHPLAFERDKELAEFRKKGRHWTEQEKLWLMDKQMELLSEVVPLYRELQERGQVELTTTPFFHPILPLLWDKRQARRAMPNVNLPKYLESYPNDVRDQIRHAIKFHRKLFGVKPRGMWPAEGSVCQGIIPVIADAGIHWIATDEEILACSTDGRVSRDGNGFLRNPEMLYRPWRVEEQGKSLQIIFRDHAMSDQIGFHYQRDKADHAVDDFSGKIEAIGNATGGNGRRPTLVSIILDGENCWEYYPGGGVDFLRSLYRRVAGHPKIAPVRVCDYLDQFPAADKLAHLFPGSWIGHNFGIWIGHHECNRAWDLLHETRQHLVQIAEQKVKPKKHVDRAWEELAIAEGSDWFWWFGDDHSSSQDDLFDRLFRKHLQNVYLLLGEEPPAELAKPIADVHRYARLYSEPTGLLSVKINGRRTYFEWINAGHYVNEGARGAMAMAGESLVSDLYFGFDHEHLLVRLDARDGAFRERLAHVTAVRVVFLRPEKYEVLVSGPARKKLVARLLHRGKAATEETLVAIDLLFELSVPFGGLDVAADDPICFYVELLQGKQSLERIPGEGAIETAVPSENYESMMWQV